MVVEGLTEEELLVVVREEEEVVGLDEEDVVCFIYHHSFSLISFSLASVLGDSQTSILETTRFKANVMVNRIFT